MIRASEIRLANTPETAVTEAEILNILSVADLKREVRRTDASEDTKFQDAIEEAYYRLDGPLGWLNRSILAQQWVGVVDLFDDKIEIPLPPTKQVDQIRYRDENGTWQVLSTDVYGESLYGLVGFIYRKKDQTWPDIHTDPGSVEITFTAGYEDGATVLANMRGIRKALKLLAGHYFHNPLPTFAEPRTIEVPREVMWGLKNAIGQYQIVNDHS